MRVPPFGALTPQNETTSMSKERTVEVENPAIEGETMHISEWMYRDNPTGYKKVTSASKKKAAAAKKNE